MTEDFLSLIEDASLNASAPSQQRWIDGWLVRYCPGKAKRARSVNAVAAGRMPLEHKLVRAAAIYDEARLPMIVRITPFSQPARLDAELDARGWQRFDDTRVMVAPTLPSASRRWPERCVPRQVGHAEFAEVVGRLRGTPLDQRSALARRLSASPVAYFGRLLERDGEVLACGQYTIDAGHVGLYDIFTAASARGQGLAQALCFALLQEAREKGGSSGYLQVDASNAPAIAVYRKLGFVDGYRYHYRAIDPSQV